MARLSDFLVGRVIQVKIKSFLSPKVYPKAGVSQGSNLSSLLFLIYVNDMPNATHHQTNKSKFADDAGQWAVSKNIDLAAEYLQSDLDKLARWCAKWRIKLNPEKTKVIIFSKSRSAIRAEPALSLYGHLLSYYPHINFLGITFDKKMTFTKHFEEILECCNQKFYRLRILVNKKWGRLLVYCNLQISGQGFKFIDQGLWGKICTPVIKMSITISRLKSSVEECFSSQSL